MKCPYCGSNDVEQIIPDQQNSNISFVITEMNTATNTFIPNSGVSVKVYGCQSCSGILLRAGN